MRWPVAVAMTRDMKSIGTNQLTLDGNFGGALASGLLLRYAARGPSSDLASTAQAASYVYTASDTNLKIGATSARAWRWAPP